MITSFDKNLVQGVDTPDCRFDKPYNLYVEGKGSCFRGWSFFVKRHYSYTDWFIINNWGSFINKK